MPPILTISHISKTYAAHRALNDVSMTIPKGSIYGLLGPNGAGKTSLIRIITQITGADSGEIFFNDERLHPSHVQRIGYLPEERGLYRKMEVGEQLIYFARLKGMSRTDAIHKLKTWVEKFEIDSWWQRKVEELSKGMQQKVQFIATVLHEPELIILDEPFSGFDPINANLLTEEILALRKHGCSIIFSTHRMESVEQLCDHIALINRSEKVLEGPVQEIRSRFRTSVYEAEYRSEAPVHAEGFSLIQSAPIPGGFRDLYHIDKGQYSAELVKWLATQTELVSFREQIPGMQEIFVKVVNNEAVLEA